MKARITILYHNGELHSSVHEHTSFGVGNYTTSIRLGAMVVPFKLIKEITIMPLSPLSSTNVEKVDEQATAQTPLPTPRISEAP